LLCRADGIPGGEAGREELGASGERHAVGALRREGCRIVETNYRCRAGEIDIVAIDGETLAFVEVKTRRTEEKGRPEESVHERKRRRMAHAALCYIRDKRLPRGVKYRFDVVSILRRPDGAWETKILRNAFRLDEIGMAHRV
jgi:putative endonuclease